MQYSGHGFESHRLQKLRGVIGFDRVNVSLWRIGNTEAVRTGVSGRRSKIKQSQTTMFILRISH